MVFFLVLWSSSWSYQYHVLHGLLMFLLIVWSSCCSSCYSHPTLMPTHVCACAGRPRWVSKILHDTKTPHMHGVYWGNHRPNVVVKELSHLLVLANIENLLHTLHNYFARSPERHLEFFLMSKVRQTKGLNIIQNVKTSWLGMLWPLKRVMPKYRTFVHKMHGEAFDITTTHACQKAARLNFDLLVDAFIPIALCCFILLLETMRTLVISPNNNTYSFATTLPRWKCDRVSCTPCIVTLLHISNKIHSGTRLIYYNASMIQCLYVGPYCHWT